MMVEQIEQVKRPGDAADRGIASQVAPPSPHSVGQATVPEVCAEIHRMVFIAH